MSQVYLSAVVQEASTIIARLSYPIVLPMSHTLSDIRLHLKF